jgi:1-phosphofructokinase
MILTLTPNPSLDRALDLDALVVGEVNRAHDVHVDAGGKGINVSRALVAQGVPSLAVLPVGGTDGARIVRLLDEVGVPADPVPVHGDTRSNITLVEASGATTKVNAPGVPFTPREVRALLTAVERHLEQGPSAVVGAGSLPAGVDDDFYVLLARLAARYGVPLVLDTSGAPLERAVAAGGLELIKPNELELAELVGHPIATVGDTLAAAREVIARGTRRVLVSLGAHGALLVTADAAWWAGGPALVPASTVGAGDTTLAGYLAAGVAPVRSSGAPDEPAPDDPGARLRTAVAWGRAAVLLPGTQVPTPDDVRLDAVSLVAEPDPALTLKEL